MRTDLRFILRLRSPWRPGAIAKRLAFATIATLLATATSLATADVQLDASGRRLSTGPKGPQQGLDESVFGRRDPGSGIVSGLTRSGPTESPSGPVSNLPSGRLVRATPIQPVSVGLVGCPGCTLILGTMGGLFIDLPFGRSGEFGHDRRRPVQTWRPKRRGHSPRTR